MTEQEREMDIALAEAEQENRLLRARNERLMSEKNLMVSGIEEAIKQLQKFLQVA